MKRIILDTNFMLIPSLFKVDIFSEISRICDFAFETAVLDKTINELKGIINKGEAKQRAAAKLALQFIEKKKLSIIKTTAQKSVDSLLVSIADRDTIIATQDMELKRRLKEKSIQTITMRQKKYLILV